MEKAEILNLLEETIKARKSAEASASYVAQLFQKGRPKIAQKVGEEAVEVVIEALASPVDAEKLAGEAADLLFHLMVLLEDCGLSLDDVLMVLESRHGKTGLRG